MFKPYLDQYPENVSPEIGELPYNSLLEMFDTSFDKFSGQCAFDNMGKEISYGELNKKSAIIAAYLQQTLKLKFGDRVAVMMPNLLQYPVVLLGILRAGMVVVNVNPLYTAHELKHQLSDSGAKAIFIVSNFAVTLEEVISETDIEHVVLSRIGDELTVIKRNLVDFVITYVKKMVPKYKLPDAVSYRKALKLGSQNQFIKPIVGLDDIAFIQYTGGTTGVSKGAVLTHQNMLATVYQAEGVFHPVINEGEEVIITALPLYHAFALSVNFMLFLKAGGKNILITNPRDMAGFLDTLAKNKFTILTGLNTLFLGMMNHEKFASIDFKALKATVSGGMTTLETVADDWLKRTGCVIIEGYGLTECSPLVSCNVYNLKAFNGSIGLPMPSTDVRLRDDNDEIVAEINMAGEVEVRGPQVMKGYWNNEEETKNTMTSDGWLKTGDIGQFDEKGLLYIVDRKKDMILVSGFNVYPNEIEAALSKMDGIEESAVIGVESERSGEAVKAFVVLSDHSITIKDIKEHCKGYLTGYKRPHDIEVVTELPKNNVGKVLRRLLKER